jgi:hypothetical protein
MRWGIVVVIMLVGCSGQFKQGHPQDVTCTASCTECKDVELSCHKTGKSENDEVISITGMGK